MTKNSSIAQLALLTLCAFLIYAICAGFRDIYGLLLPHVCAATGLGYATVSFVIALGQLVFGVMQPVFGYFALRASSRTALLTGCAMMLAGLALIPFSHNAFLLSCSLGVLLPGGTAGASFGILMGCLAGKMNRRQVDAASGFVAGGIGFSICALSPVLQMLASRYGLNVTISFLCVLCLLLVPSILTLTGASGAPTGKESGKIGFMAILREGIRNRVWVALTFGFFTCGFHMALIQTHLFSQLNKSGIPAHLSALVLSVYGIGVICGTIGSGFAGNHFSMGRILTCLYFSRCALVGFLLIIEDIAGIFFIVLALGLTGVATVPPTAGLIRNVFGTLKLPTLFGMTYAVHQAGAFASAWAGGLCLKFTGGYDLIWQINICLCFFAGCACLGIGKESSAE